MAKTKTIDQLANEQGVKPMTVEKIKEISGSFPDLPDGFPREDDKGVYQPDYAVAPGETLREARNDRGYKNAYLQCCLGLSEYKLRQLFKGELEITVRMAEELESLFNIKAYFWLNLQAQYDETKKRIENGKD